MKPFEFRIIDKCFQDASQLPGNDADFYLEENDWNDYYYYVLYHLHATKRLTGTKNMLLGNVRIMQKGQQKNKKFLLSEVFRRTVFNELPSDFVSLSLEYDLYKWLSFKPVEERKAFANQLHLILSKDSPYYEMVKDDDCFKVAMLRDTTLDNYIFYKANQWINQTDRRYELRKQQIALKYDNCDDEVRLSFSCLPSVDSNDIPNGIVAFIGANGSGKSTALYSLAKAMYLYPEDREQLNRKFCQIVPNDIGVERLILISYSPFDNFTFPTTINYAMHDVQEVTREQDGRFVYCGIRDVDEEYRAQQDNGVRKDLKFIQLDRHGITVAKTQERLAADFALAFKQLREGGDQKRFSNWVRIIEEAKTQHPDLSEKMMQMGMLDKPEEWKELFMGLSTGYKFLFHSLAYVLAFVLEGSLILFDEPENHIHPPLLSFMMAQYRNILAEFSSVMLVSTHSPVIIQELFAENVLKVYREGSKIRIRKPVIETYGATFGEINSEVFGLTADVARYFSAVDVLYDAWNLGGKASVNEMMEALRLNLGRSVSNQIASYLISKFFQDNPEID